MRAISAVAADASSEGLGRGSFIDLGRFSSSVRGRRNKPSQAATSVGLTVASVDGRRSTARGQDAVEIRMRAPISPDIDT